MSEPATIGTAAGAAVSLPLLVLGAHPDAILLGLFGAMLATANLESIGTLRRAFSATLLGSLAAGYFSPHAAAIVAAQVSALSDAADALRMPMALLIGAGTPTLWPLALRSAERRLTAQDAEK